MWPKASVVVKFENTIFSSYLHPAPSWRKPFYLLAPVSQKTKQNEMYKDAQRPSTITFPKSLYSLANMSVHVCPLIALVFI